MSSEITFVEYVITQLSSLDDVRYKKMFGEYAIYYKNKIVALICDNQFLVKITKQGEDFIKNYETALPYPGAKPCFLIDEKLEDSDFCSELIRITYSDLPEPKIKKKKSKL
ncbi:MAG: TfoX/Sxy family protein [Candidatus Cloacimonadales bacterium]|jgi:TfoX/Sxy family transcriptional regulator of competence genes|nr:TfoX/Sxy family protein [Acholeplasmataceae bacterium]MCK9427969.1 TfoX/Sxy family protein [Acholeplasmataceae bacterium]MDD4156407.1 TfoX/Sxy family protein [Candidatus Cloacimonadota bacterium]MDX9977687.1 TfoX/Sxy family protein [Candidatus Cloacimonadales bacterium]